MGMFNPVWEFAVGILLGLLLASFLEYAIHRWVLHGPLKRHHWLHHRDPVKAYPLPQWFSLGGTYLIFAVSMGLMPSLLWALGTAFGAFVHTVFYEDVHYYIHRDDQVGRYMVWMAQRHDDHHRCSGVNFAVTTPVWDWLFGTYCRD